MKRFIEEFKKESIYIVNEQIMNGTVTININIFGIKAKTFKNAKEVLIKNLNKLGEKVKIDFSHENATSFSYIIWDNTHPVYGSIKDEPLRLLE